MLIAGAPARCACDNATRLSRQVDALLAEYERESPPPDAPVTVTLGLDVRHAALDQQQSTMRLLADLRMVSNHFLFFGFSRSYFPNSIISVILR